MSSLNQVILIGHLGKDPEIRDTKNNKELAFFSLATSKNWKNKSTGERESKTEWHNIAVFNEQLVGVIKSYVKKGSKIYLEGELQTSKYTDKNGEERYQTKVVLDYGAKILLLDNKDSKNESGNEQSNTQEQPKSFINESLDDEIPF